MPSARGASSATKEHSGAAAEACTISSALLLPTGSVGSASPAGKRQRDRGSAADEGDATSMRDEGGWERAAAHQRRQPWLICVCGEPAQAQRSRA